MRVTLILTKLTRKWIVNSDSNSNTAKAAAQPVCSGLGRTQRQPSFSWINIPCLTEITLRRSTKGFKFCTKQCKKKDFPNRLQSLKLFILPSNPYVGQKEHLNILTGQGYRRPVLTKGVLSRGFSLSRYWYSTKVQFQSMSSLCDVNRLKKKFWSFWSGIAK